MNRKGLIVEGPSIWVIGIGLIFFILLFGLVGIVFTPANGSIDESSSLASSLRINELLTMKSLNNQKTTLELLEENCIATNEERSSEIKRRSRMMFDNLFVSAQFECSNGNKIILRDYICEEPKIFPVIMPDGTTEKIHFCDQPNRVATNDGKEWVQHKIYRDRLIELAKGEQSPLGPAIMPDMTLLKFRREYAFAG